MNPALKARRVYSRELGMRGVWGAPFRAMECPVPGENLDGTTMGVQKSLLDGLHFTQQGLAELFIRLHGEVTRYCHDSRTWRIWDGTRWKRDETEEIFRLILGTVRTIHHIADTWEIENDNDRIQQEQIKRWAIRSETRRTMEEALKLVRVNESIAVTENLFDADPYLLNIQNGTLDLRSGELQDHRQGDYISMLAPVVYDRDAKCPNWESFIRAVAGEDGDLIRYLQQVTGYALTEDAREEVFYLLYGPPQSGKTTFLEVIRALLGDYARQADFSTFVASRFISPNSPRSDLVRLSRARLVTASEAESGQRWAEGLIKRLTGGDTVTARALYRESHEYRPGFKLCFALNDLPDVRPEEEAFWRRTIVIPFNHKVSEEKVDKSLREKLKSELPGILAWAVRGCLDWQRHGFTVPSVIREATNKYREETDTIRQFLDECCTVEARARVLSGDIYSRYVAWSKTFNLEPVSHKAFIQYLVRKLACAKKRGERQIAHT
ncbi:phage protein [Alicyclobacillus contaminans]|uniref:DNA primase family protein n=1 Tax=Alicyclobacillus contaminans TaxID=392016 RepID=UPI00146FA266|nr:phage/plasmid primase, P4 family [Alicyclobacillus contaminans]GMA50720.1 phage protein [Alicyclobacillus contaminans]